MSTDHSRVRPRPAASRHTTPSYVPQAESLILPDGPVGEEAAELLNEFVHPHHRTEDTLIGGDDSPYFGVDHSKPGRKLPWWKTPSPLWFLILIPFSSIAMSATIAPRIEIYTMLACSVHKPDIFKETFPQGDNGWDYVDTSLRHSQHHHHQHGREASMPLFGPQRVRLPAGVITADFGTLRQNDTDHLPPKGPNLCAKDPTVQAAVAKLTATIATTLGVLSCVTTGWWSAVSDRLGRKRVMGIIIFGLLFTDANFILVALFHKRMPGGYWFLLAGPVVEGCLGGLTSATAAIHAYMADTTTESTRSHIFSLNLGLLFTGMALGPTLGSLLIRFTGQTLSVFYVATVVHTIYACFAWFIIPESLSRERMARAQAKYAAELRETARERELNPAVGMLVRVKRLFTFLSPLTVFMPEVSPLEEGANPLKRRSRDWNLTLIALGYGFTISLMGSYTYKFQYAASAFGWTSEILGYWLSLVGAARAFFLTIMLPIAIKLFKPQPFIIELPLPPREDDSEPGETQPLLSHDPTNLEASPSSSSLSEVSPPKTFKKEIHSPAFDLNLAIVSLFVDVIAYFFMAFSTHPMAFTLFGMLGSFGAGFSPAVQSVALALYARRGGTESGRLFGALSVIQALSAQILGPALYGLIYMKTVATFPRAIFFVSVASVVISFILLNMIRLPKEGHLRPSGDGDLEESGASNDGGHVHEGTLVDFDDDENRGRKRHVTPPTVTVSSPTD